MRHVIVVALVMVQAGCAPLRPFVSAPTPVKEPDRFYFVMQTEATKQEDKKAVCALRLLANLRADGRLEAALREREYDFSRDGDEAVNTVEGVIACAVHKPLYIPWRLRECHFIEWLNREVGANVETDDGFYIRTYECRAQEYTVGQLAGHLLHEHMHTCGYTDQGGDSGTGLVTYTVNTVVWANWGRENNCPELGTTPQ